MTILDTIIENKRVEVMKRRARKPMDHLTSLPLWQREPLRPADFFSRKSPNIIAEFKRKSPSGGILNSHSLPALVAEDYKQGGAAAVSVLTDRNFFAGDLRDLQEVKTNVANIPLLRKDFMIDPYQVHEAKAYGADIILLIAAVLTPLQTRELSLLAVSLGMTVLLEVHREEELDRWCPEIGMVGVNNRDLASLRTDIGISFELAGKLPAGVLKISESGLKQPEDIKMLFAEGYNGFLMGERFMAEDHPGKAFAGFMNLLNKEE